MIYEQEINNAFNSLLSKVNVEVQPELNAELQALKLLIDFRTQLLQNFVDQLHQCQKQLADVQNSMDDEDGY